MERFEYTDNEIWAHNEITRRPIVNQCMNTYAIHRVKTYMDKEFNEVLADSELGFAATYDEAYSIMAKFQQASAHDNSVSCIKHSYYVKMRELVAPDA